MKTNQRWNVISLILLTSFAGPLYADFDVVEPRNEYYGNAQADSFHRAISGGTTVNAEEEKMLAEVTPFKTTQRYYGRFRINFSNMAVDALENKSTGPEKDATLLKKRTSITQTGLEMAVGYAWSKNVRGDIEYIANKNIVYSASPVLAGNGITSRALSTWIKNNTLLFNVYYEMTGIYRFTPYVTLGAGIAVNSVQSLLSPPPTGIGSESTRNMSLAWTMGTGVRINVFKRWFIDTSYRYMNLGSGLTIKPGDTYKLNGDLSSNVVSIGMIYLF